MIEFLIENNFANRKIIIPEGSAIRETEEGFKNFGYYELKKLNPKLQFLNLNKEDTYEIEIYGKNLNPKIQ